MFNWSGCCERGCLCLLIRWINCTHYRVWFQIKLEADVDVKRALNASQHKRTHVSESARHRVIISSWVRRDRNNSSDFCTVSMGLCLFAVSLQSQAMQRSVGQSARRMNPWCGTWRSRCCGLDVMSLIYSSRTGSCISTFAGAGTFHQPLRFWGRFGFAVGLEWGLSVLPISLFWCASDFHCDLWFGPGFGVCFFNSNWHGVCL